MKKNCVIDLPKAHNIDPISLSKRYSSSKAHFNSYSNLSESAFIPAEIPQANDSYMSFNTIAIQCTDGINDAELTPRFQKKGLSSGSSHHFNGIKLKENKSLKFTQTKYSPRSQKNALLIYRCKTPPCRNRPAFNFEKSKTPSPSINPSLAKIFNCQTKSSSNGSFKLLDTRWNGLIPQRKQKKKNTLFMVSSPKVNIGLSLVNKLDKLVEKRRKNEARGTSLHGRMSPTNLGYRSKYQKDPVITRNSLGIYSYEDTIKKDNKKQIRIIRNYK
ncbi:unnamed protein product [Blepharisma stoltei]|uniref:Uncharacterized protein n=1 Tax=Blepharisma stoltei TaxID=1481888 RepID=A0AAU9J8D3_9CILI|nr:unnamed protein product [Blepharisma stoltei]